MKSLEKLSLRALHCINPEIAHNIAISAMKARLIPKPGAYTSTRVACQFAGLKLPNPIGLAAGLDKNATAIHALVMSGFGFIEVGAVTPKPQQGNPKPRLFRLDQDQAIINRFGFNNNGMHIIAKRLSKRPHYGIVGLNLGANKNSPDRTIDYLEVLKTCGTYSDFVTINVSSPNTEKLRDLQEKKALTDLLNAIIKTRDTQFKSLPVFLKIAPDLTQKEIKHIAIVAKNTQIDGIIATNTTLDRTGLKSPYRSEKGGLSGAPLFEKSTQVLAYLARELEGNIPIIGVGGIRTAEQAYRKIRLGASAVQLYTATIYKGITLGYNIAKELDDLLANDGFDHISQAVGIDL